MGSLFGGGGPSPQQNALYSTQQKAIEQGLAGSTGDLTSARSALAGPEAFFNALLTGDRTTVMNTLSPEISTLTSQYDTNARAANEFAPRGGGRTAELAEAPSKLSSDISNLVSGARTTGAAGMTGIGQIFAQLGLGELGTGLSGASNLSGELLQQQQNKQQQQAAAGQGIGALLALLVGA